MNSIHKQWPDDADGDVLRRMDASGFDFEEPCLIDFNVDFDCWPPSDAAMQMLYEMHSNSKAISLEGEGGYVCFHIHARLSYELVVNIQRLVSERMASFGGVCESLGVLH